MATELAQAYVQIIPSADGISGKLQSLLGGEAQSVGASVGGIFSGALGSAVQMGSKCNSWIIKCSNWIW